MVHCIMNALDITPIFDDELNQEKYINRTHGTLSCYNSGCRGLMCKYARRVDWSARTGVDNATDLDPIIKHAIEIHKKERDTVRMKSA
jgi:hypothetical protein